MNALPAARFRQYEVTAELGRGGMGTVYAALDRARGRMVALKCLSLERLAEASERARYTALFEREYYALSQLDHPHIIRAYDFGLDEVGPYYTMELLEGESLRTRAPWPWSTACSLLRDIVSALSHLHARSLVHRDVTPLNIYCTPDGRAKLIDFGAMMPAGVPKQIVGTPAFIAPECVEGQSVDGRTDLFALGACLYYALTGQHAYPARTLLEVRQMWQMPPHAVSSLAPDVPPALEELVYSLLHLRAENRPRTAADVYERLSVIAGLPREEGSAAAAAYLGKPKLVGRERQEHSLRRRSQQAAEGAGGALLLAAQAGLGRTRMLDAAARQAQLAGLRIARADASAGALASFAVVKRLFEGLAADTPALLQTLRELGLAELQPSSGSSAADSRKHRLSELVSALEASCQAAPCALLVDDVHAIDEPSLALLAELSTRANEHSLLIVSTCAQAEGAEPSAALSLLVRSSRRLELAPLTAAETRELVVSLFGEVPNVDLLSTLLAQHARGVPGRVMQAADACLQRDLVRYDAGSFCIASAKDPLLRVISAHARPERDAPAISPEARRLLQVIAFDRFEQLEIADYQRLLGASEAAPVYRALIELRDARRVEWLDERARLAHEGERQALTDELSAARRRELHTALAELSALRQLPAIFAAHHWFAAGEPARGTAAMDAFESFVNDNPEAEVLRHPITLEATQVASQLRDFPGAHPALRAKFGAGLILNASYVGRVELAAELLPEVTRALAQWSGVADYEMLSVLPEEQRLTQALTRASERCAQPGVGALDVVQALRRQAQLSVQTAVAAGFMQDMQLLGIIPDLAPFRALSPALALAAQTVAGLSMHVRGQLWAAWDSLRQTHATLCEPHIAQLEPMTRMALQRTVLLILAGLNADLGAEGALALIEQCAAFMPDVAESQRCRYHLARGDFAAAAAARRRFELASVRAGTFSDARIVELPAHLTMYALCQDGVGLSRSVQTLREVAATRPGFAARVLLANALWQQSQGHHGEALANVTRALAEYPPPHADWQLTAALHVELLSAAGRSAEAVASGREHLQRAEHAQLPTYRIAFALTEACMREALYAEAEQRFAESVAELEERGVRGVLVGCGYELGARIAMAQGHATDYRQRAARCLSHFELGDHPALRARYNALLRDAARGGLHGQVTAPPRAADVATLRMRLERLVTHATHAGENADFHRGMLDVLIEQAAAIGGVLYRRRGAAMERVAAVGALASRAGLDALVHGAAVSSDADRTVLSEALTQRVTSADLELYSLLRPGAQEVFVAALEVGLLTRKRIPAAVLQEIAESLGRPRAQAVDASVSADLPSGVSGRVTNS